MVTLELVYILLCAEFISADDDGDVRAGTSLHDRHHRRRSTIARRDRRRTARRTASSLGHVRQDQSVLIEVAIPYLRCVLLVMHAFLSLATRQGNPRNREMPRIVCSSQEK